MEQHANQPSYTHEEFERYAQTHRCEWIDGAIFDMAGTHANHGLIPLRLGGSLSTYLQGKPCKVYSESVTVQFYEGDRCKADVQPDIKVVCGSDKVRNGIIIAAPTFIMEILSPGTASIDYVTKMNLYQRYGVQEYWIVSWEERAISVYRMVDGRYEVERVACGIVPSTSLPGFAVDLSALFADLDGA